MRKRSSLFFGLKKNNTLTTELKRNLYDTFVRNIEDICFFSVKDRNLLHRVDTIGNIFTSGAATSENITDGVHSLSGKSFIKIQYSSFSLFPVAYPFRIATQLQYYVKREKCKVNDVIFPSGCGARAINLGNKNMKIGNFTGATSVRLKNIFLAISRYPTGKHAINRIYLYGKAMQ